jgi:hypothetical protein
MWFSPCVGTPDILWYLGDAGIILARALSRRARVAHETNNVFTHGQEIW